jgi:hypothetical protein
MYHRVRMSNRVLLLTSLTLHGFDLQGQTCNKHYDDIISLSTWQCEAIMRKFKSIHRITFNNIHTQPEEQLWKFLINNRHYFVQSNYFPELVFSQSPHTNSVINYYDQKLDEHKILYESSTPLSGGGRYEFHLDCISQLPQCKYTNNRHASNCSCQRFDMLTFLTTYN